MGCQGPRPWTMLLGIAEALCGLTGFVGSWPLLVIGEREILCAVYVHHVGEVEHVRQAAVSPGVRLRPGRYSHPAGHDAVTGRQDTGRSHPSGGARGYAAAVCTCVGRDSPRA